MRLYKWRKIQGWTQIDLARALDCSQPFISSIERTTDQQIPGREMMLRIYRLTRGDVRPNDFYDLPSLDQLQLPIEETDAPLLQAVA